MVWVKPVLVCVQEVAVARPQLGQLAPGAPGEQLFVLMDLWWLSVEYFTWLSFEQDITYCVGVDGSDANLVLRFAVAVGEDVAADILLEPGD